MIKVVQRYFSRSSGSGLYAFVVLEDIRGMSVWYVAMIVTDGARMEERKKERLVLVFAPSSLDIDTKWFVESMITMF